MELIKIVNARNVLVSLSDHEDISLHLSYWMAKFVAKTESEYNFYTVEMRKVFDKYAQKNDSGEFFIPVDQVNDFNTDIAKIGEMSVEDPGIRFNLSELSSELKLSMKQIYPLLDFIDEDK